ncbi:neurite extension and migration factor isoform X1 [Oryzias latipes]|uniref:Neurite extension and migration factor n=2 Tax=Oryzias latipes TaxID=8090 RepID=H2LNR7_ORYLA|nr:neurite extension and migration factor isoform X1 [Oryzias latipes]
MDVLTDTCLTLMVKTSELEIPNVENTGVCEQSGDLSLCGLVNAALPPSSSPPPAAETLQRACITRQRTTPTSASLRLPVGTDPSLCLTVAPCPASDDAPSVVPHLLHSSTSLPDLTVSTWSPAGDAKKPPPALPVSLPLSSTMMEPGPVSALTEECLLQPTRNCLGCYIETRDASDATAIQNPSHDPNPNTDPGLSVRIGDVSREDYSDINNISIQCLSHAGETTSHYGEQLLSDQLLSFPLPKTSSECKRADGNKATVDCEDPEDDATAKNLYEGLLLDKVSGEEALLANAGQDWGYFESFISESKMELLDLCSKNELSVNLFSEEDVDNLFDDEDDDSTLSSDVCSLKIRYESFQDNMREKTNVLQEETQFNFFPSVLTNCAKKEDGAPVLKRSTEGLQPKADELIMVTAQEVKPADCSGSLDDSQGSPMSTSKVSYLIDFNSTEESGEFSDDSSCTGSSSDTLQEGRFKKGPSKRFLSPSNPLNYGLRSKRKVRYSDDYLYDVDSLESEKNAEKKEKPPSGQKEEEDVDWCPKKRRKSCRKEPPVVIKYIIINRFKGERLMSVKLGKLDPVDSTVSLNADTVGKYETLAPLKAFWQEKQRERQEQFKLAARDKQQRGFHLNGRHHRPFNSSHPKRKYKIANRLKVQRIHTVEQSATAQNSPLSDQGQGSVTKEETTPTVRGIIAAPGLPVTLDTNSITHTVTAKSRSQEREEREGRRLGGNKTFRIRKFKSEARLRSKKMKEAEGEEGRSVTNEADACVSAAQIEDPTAGLEQGGISSTTAKPNFSDNATTTQASEEKFPFVSSTCSPDKATSSEEVETGVPVIPGGYLQTLLDATDSSSGAAISYFPQQSSRQQYPLGLSLEEKQFSSLQLAQSCVLSPPSESELQQSPQNCPSFPQMWHQQLCANHSQSFGPETPDTPILPNNFPAAVPLNDNLPVSNYSQLSPEADRLLYEKSYLTEAGLQPGADLQVCQSACVEGQVQYQRGSLSTDNGRLISYDSVGSLSASSSNYSSLSLKSCEREGEEEGRDGFLTHCSPKLVIQQSVDALTPLRESSDLLDISNFTPDKFRHSSLSELSPPETPNLSPQVVGREMKMAGNVGEYQDANEMTVDCNMEVKWNCEAIQQQERTTNAYIVEDGQFPLHSFNSQEVAGLDKKDKFDSQASDMLDGAKSIKSKRKSSCKQTTAGQSPKKARAPRAPKSEKVKTPKQNSRSTKKIKAMLEGKAAKNQAGGCGTGLTDSSSTGDWSGTGWSESNSLVGDDQREFEEPSNILSNIVSGMAEVQRFMMASIEPLWNPMSEACMPSEANSLNLKTLKILAGTEADLKKKGAVLTGAGRGRKPGGKGVKNQAKFNPSHPLFPQLALGCNMFDKPNFINPGPAHKKLYRHKTSAKFPRIETLKGKRAERDPNKDIALMTSFEKLRIWMSCCCCPSYTAWLISRGKSTVIEPCLNPRHLKHTRWDHFVLMTYQTFFLCFFFCFFLLLFPSCS